MVTVIRPLPERELQISWRSEQIQEAQWKEFLQHRRSRFGSMLEDVIYEVLPVIGIAAMISAGFVLVVFHKSRDNHRLFALLAIADLLGGCGDVMAGFYGIVQTLRGQSSEYQSTHPLSCLLRGAHVVVFAYADSLDAILLSLCLLDRLIQIFVPNSYDKISRVYLCNRFIPFMCIAALGGVIPAFAVPFLEAKNETAKVAALCRYEEVVGASFYSFRLDLLQWLPTIGVCVVAFVFFVYFLRMRRPSWCYNWAEKHTKEMLTAILFRCLFMEAAVQLIVVNFASEGASNELLTLRDYLLRSAISLLVTVLAPAVYMVILKTFSDNVSTIFNAYGKEPEKMWQSADDPPPDIVMERAEYGSWYSMTGNIVGEAGVPDSGPAVRVGEGRSASFYFDSPPPSDAKRPCPPALSHKSKNLKPPAPDLLLNRPDLNCKKT